MPSPIVVPMVPELIFGGRDRAHAFPHRRVYGPRAYIRRSCTCLPPSSCLWSPSLYSEAVHMPSPIVVSMIPELIFGGRGRAHAFPHHRAYGPRAYIRRSCTCLPPSSCLWSPSLYSEVVHMPSPIVVPMVPELIFGGRAHAFPHRRVYGPRAYIRRSCTCLPPSSCLWSPSLYSEVVHMPSPIVVSMVPELIFGGRAHAFPHHRAYGPRAYIRRSCTCLPPSSCLWSPSLYSEVVHMPSPIVVSMVPELIFGGRGRAHAFPHRRVYGPRAYIRRSCTCLPPSSCLWSPSLYSEVVHMPSPIVVSMVPELIFGGRGRAHAFPHRRVYGPRAYIRRPWSCTCLPPSSCLWSPSLYSEAVVVHMPSPIVVSVVPELIFGGRAHAFPHRRVYGPRAYIRRSCTCLPPSSCLWSPSLYSEVVHMPSPIVVSMVPELIFGGRAHAFPHRRVYGPRAYIRRSWSCTCLPPSSCLWSPSLYSEVVVVHMPSPIVVSMIPELIFGGRAHAFPHRRVYDPRAYIRRSCTCLPASSCLWSPSLYSEVVHMPSRIVVSMIPELIFGGRAHAFPHRRVYDPRAYIRRSCTCLPPSSCLWSPSLYSEVVHMPSPIVVSMIPELIFGGRAHAFPHRRAYGPRAYIRRS